MPTLSAVKITQSQTHLLLAMLLSGTAEEARHLMSRSDKAHTSSQVLRRMGFIEATGSTARVTDLGFAELVHNGYITDIGELTPYGQTYYQTATTDLNEFYIIHTLLRN